MSRLGAATSSRNSEAATAAIIVIRYMIIARLDSLEISFNILHFISQLGLVVDSLLLLDHHLCSPKTRKFKLFFIKVFKI